MSPERLKQLGHYVERGTPLPCAMASELLEHIEGLERQNAAMARWLTEARALAESKFGGTNTDFWTIAAAGLAEAGIDSLKEPRP